MAHVLLIDHDPVLRREQGRQACRSPKHPVDVATTGAEWLKIAATDSPGLILLDLCLSNQSGLQRKNASMGKDGPAACRKFRDKADRVHQGRP